VDRLARIAAIEETHFWFAGRRELLMRLLAPYLLQPKRILDAGCGTGSMLRELRRRGQDAVGVDSLPEAVGLARSGAPGVPVELGDVTGLPFASGSFDGVLLLDVLEHVDDRRALAEASRVLRPGGFLAVSVPACPWLWSRRDELAGHRRRYDRRSLLRRIDDAGFDVRRSTHYQLLLFPLVVLTRVLGRRKPAWLEREDHVPSGIRPVLAVVNQLEARVAARVSLPLGSSIVAVAVKR
jgi:SAM-dependent methyltransferase